MAVMFPRSVQRFVADQSTPITKAVPGAILLPNLRDYAMSPEDVQDMPTVPLLQDARLSDKAKKKEILTMIDEKLAAFGGTEHDVNDDHRQGTRLIWALLRLLCEHDGVLPGR